MSPTNLSAVEATLVRHTIQIAASRETVFEFLIKPELMIKWMGISADLEPQPGGKFKLQMNSDDIALGEYSIGEAPARVVFSWGWQNAALVPPGSSKVEITLSEKDGGTFVELLHTGLHPEKLELHKQGWNYCLSRLGPAAMGEDPGPWKM